MAIEFVGISINFLKDGWARGCILHVAVSSGDLDRTASVSLPLEGDGFEPVWGFSCQAVIFGL
jgi:hypothetical protein